MTIYYNIKAAVETWKITQGDDIQISRTVSFNGLPHDMTNSQLDIHIKRHDGKVIKVMSSAGISPCIFINGNIFDIDCAGISQYGLFKADVQETTVFGKIQTIGEITVRVDEEITV